MYIQELTVRLGVFTGRGHGELIRERFGIAGLVAATIGSLVAEFAGVGELFSLPRPFAALTLLAIVATGSYKRVERAALL